LNALFYGLNSLTCFKYKRSADKLHIPQKTGIIFVGYSFFKALMLSFKINTLICWNYILHTKIVMIKGDL